MHSDQLHKIRYTYQADNPSAPSYQEVLESWEQHHHKGVIDKCRAMMAERCTAFYC